MYVFLNSIHIKRVIKRGINHREDTVNKKHKMEVYIDNNWFLLLWMCINGNLINDSHDVFCIYFLRINGWEKQWNIGLSPM